MARELGSIADQRELSPLLVAGHTYRECVRLTGWPYGRVSEAARAIKGLDSDSRDGRRRRDTFADAKARTNANLKAQLEAYRERVAR